LYRMDKQGGVAEIVYDICRALVESPSTPAYSEVHESLAPVVSSADSRELLDWMVNNSRARVTLDESDESLESLNLAGYSIDSVDKRLGAALARAVFRHGLEKLHLSGNSLKDLDAGLGWLVVDEAEASREPALSSIFVDANVLREVSWPPASLIAVRECLKHLDVSKSQIRSIDVLAAPLPRPITLHALEYLDISGNIKLDTLPVGFFPSVPNLRRLDAYSCALSSIPEDISVCEHLEHCGLHSNDLVNLPDALFACVKISWLSLNMNKLEALPESIGNLTNLKRLSLHQNRLRDLPAVIAKCVELEALSLHGNRLTRGSLPDSMALLENCCRLSLYENRELGSVPDGVCGMRRLKELWLYDCGLTSLNEKIGQLSDLKKLWLDKNPEMVLDDASWTALKRLDLHELYMDGQVAAATGEKAHRSTELHAAMRQLNKLYL